MSREIFRSKYAGETIRLIFDFSDQLEVGETLVSANTVASLYSGVEDSTCTVGSTTVDGAQAEVLVSASTEGSTFVVACSANTTQGQGLARQGYLATIPIST